MQHALKEGMTSQSVSKNLGLNRKRFLNVRNSVGACIAFLYFLTNPTQGLVRSSHFNTHIDSPNLIVFIIIKIGAV